MNRNDKDFMERLTDLDDESVEEIAQDYPVLDENAQKRILKQCLRKSGLPDGNIEITENTDIYEEESDEDENSVSGIERYDRPLWYKYASSVAVMAVAVAGIAGVVLLKGNMVSHDDFDISSPPVVSDVAPQTQVTEIVSGSYIDKGYHAGGHDFANDSDYQGIVVGNATVPAETSVPDNPAPPEVDYNSSENNVPATPPPATNPPATSPPETAPAVTETTTAPVSTEPPTEAESVPQKTFIEGRYFVSINDSAGVTYDGFEFSADGTIKPFLFDMPDGNFKRYKDETFGYEIIENQFSYGAIGDEPNWKIGTIIDPNDGTNFTVQFGNDVYTFDTNASNIFPTETHGFVLSGIWYGDSTYGIRKFEFYDDVSGIFNFVVAEENVEFEYKIENEHVYLKLNSGEVSEGNILNPYDGQSFSVLWDDGTTESFYSEQKWLGMNP